MFFCGITKYCEKDFGHFFVNESGAWERMVEYRTKWEKAFKNGPSKISVRQVLKDFSFLNSLSQVKICKLVFFYNVGS